MQNAWKKELCSNCFKSREEHNAAAPEAPRPVLTRAGLGVKRVAHKVQVSRVSDFRGTMLCEAKRKIAFDKSCS